MANPLFGGMQGAGAGIGANPMANAAGMAFNPAMAQKISQVMGMMRKGKDVKSIIGVLQKQGITPESAEQILCMASPQIRQIRDKMQKSGMSPKDFLRQTAKDNNVSEQDLNNMLGGMLNNT